MKKHARENELNYRTKDAFGFFLLVTVVNEKGGALIKQYIFHIKHV